MLTTEPACRRFVHQTFRKGPGEGPWSHCLALVPMLALAVVLLSGCASPYQPMKRGKGYTEAQLSPDQFQISFQGNPHTPQERANDFALLRAAQITLEHGFVRFAVIEATNTLITRTFIAKQQFYSDFLPSMGPPPPTPRAFPEYRPGYIIQYDQPTLYLQPGERLVIQCFSTNPPEPVTQDAAEVAVSLKQKYHLH